MKNMIPVNIITGFLGVGKTTVIRHLLKTKPRGQKWAVLVNEFGEVGIDGELLGNDGIAVKEVTGGCICCSVRRPSRAALRQLVAEQQPDRIIIEPTGLAFPKQIFDILSAAEFEGVLDIQATICLVDPWCFSQEQFNAVPVFIEQITVADIVVATRRDKASAEDLRAFYDYAESLRSVTQDFYSISHGALDWELLRQPARSYQDTLSTHHHHHTAVRSDILPEWDADGVIQIQNRSDFGFSCGWQFNSDWLFDADKLVAFFENTDIPRVKGIFATSQGWLIINKMRQSISREFVASAKDSRVEMITLTNVGWETIDKKLRACRFGVR